MGKRQYGNREYCNTCIFIIEKWEQTILFQWYNAACIPGMASIGSISNSSFYIKTFLKGPIGILCACVDNKMKVSI